mgnify:CR=1 FL=1
MVFLRALRRPVLCAAIPREDETAAYAELPREEDGQPDDILSGQRPRRAVCRAMRLRSDRAIPKSAKSRSLSARKARRLVR